jgi:pilus assembly protein CpaB
LKRSNRLILLIGVFLAIVAFVGIVVIFQGRGPSGPAAEVTQLPTVFTTRAITLGTPITEDMLEQRDLARTSRAADAFADISLVIGQTARKDIPEGKQLTASDFATGNAGTDIVTPPGQRAMAVQVDQVTGVGTLIRTGDYVDLLIALSGDKFPIITVNPDDDSFTVVAGVNPTSSKLLLQGMQVLGTLLPPQQARADGEEGDPGTALNGQQEIVVLSVTPQQAEVIKYAQIDGSISLVLRSAQDFRDDNGEPIVPPPGQTTGITLRTLVDEYDVLVPQLVEALVPGQTTP